MIKPNPFDDILSTREIIGLAIMQYARFPLSPVEFVRQQEMSTEGV